MNASSISYTIERIRKATGDPLFVRQGGGIVPTDQCRALMENVGQILSEAEHIAGGDEFDPAKAEGEILVSSSAYAAHVIWPNVIRRLRVEAPGVRLSFFSGSQNLRDLFQERKMDIATTTGQSMNFSGVRILEQYLPDEHVCMMDPSHPIAAKKVLSVEDFVSAGHVRFEPSPGWLQAPIRYAIEHGFQPRRIIASSIAQDLPNFVEGSDLFAALPSRLTWPWQERLALRPFDFPTPIQNSMYWSEATHRSPLKAWVRGLVIEEAGKLPPVTF